MYLLNKIVGGLFNPLVIGLTLVVAGGLCRWHNRRKAGLGLLIASVAWLWSTHAAVSADVAMPRADCC